MSEVSEFLTEDEMRAMIGATWPRKQIQWLERHQWPFEVNAAGRPIVGRVYARLRLAGVKPDQKNVTAEPWVLDMSNVN